MKCPTCGSKMGTMGCPNWDCPGKMNGSKTMGDEEPLLYSKIHRLEKELESLRARLAAVEKERDSLKAEVEKLRKENKEDLDQAVLDIQETRNELKIEMASAVDLLNTWCRELGISETREPYWKNLNLRDSIDNVWATCSSLMSRKD